MPKLIFKLQVLDLGRNYFKKVGIHTVILFCNIEVNFNFRFMYIVHVNVHVRKNYVDMFKILTTENAKESILESGIVRFDVVQQHDDPTKFVLIEVYRTFEDTAKHKLTEHYMRWRDSVAIMMKEPRTSVKYYNVFPEDEGWE